MGSWDDLGKIGSLELQCFFAITQVDARIVSKLYDSCFAESHSRGLYLSFLTISKTVQLILFPLNRPRPCAVESFFLQS